MSFEIQSVLLRRRL